MYLACRGPRHLLGGAGGGVVVDDEDLVDQAGVEELADHAGDRVLLVVGGEDDRDELALPHGCRGLRASGMKGEEPKKGSTTAGEGARLIDDRAGAPYTSGAS